MYIQLWIWEWARSGVSIPSPTTGLQEVLLVVHAAWFGGSYWREDVLRHHCHIGSKLKFKLKYLEFHFDLEFGQDAIAMVKKVKNLIYALFKEYLKLNDSGTNLMSQGADIEMSVTVHDPMESSDQHVNLSARSTTEPSIELETYLSKVPIRRSDQFNILQWWQMNSAEYPTLSRMARDILAVPASTIASELAFSTSSRVLSDFRSRITPDMVEALVCLQDWIRATANTKRNLDSVHDIILSLEGEEAPEV